MSAASYGVDDSQRRAAKLVGFAYLFAMAASMFAEGYVRGTLIVGGDAVSTARNVVAHEGLFRLGIAVELATFAADIALISALYVVLSVVDRHLALFATLLRLAAETAFVTMAAGSLDVLRTLGSAEYLQVFQADQLAALAQLGLGAHDATYGVGFIFLGVGSAVFSVLWLRSRYVPRALAALGVLASALLAAGALAFVVLPDLWRVLYPGYMVPMFFFEVGLGVWLLAKGLASPER